MLAYEDGAAAIEWLERAFGFRERRESRVVDGEGRVGHAELDVGDGSMVFLASPSPAYEGPWRHAARCEPARRWLDNPFVVDGVFVRVASVDEHCARARGEGARVLREPEDVAPVGLRVCTIEDLEGHRWMFATQL